MSNYRATPLTISIHEEDQNAVFGEFAIHVTLQDEAAGPFIVLKQNSNEISIEPDELYKIVESVDSMLKQYRENGGE